MSPALGADAVRHVIEIKVSERARDPVLAQALQALLDDYGQRFAQTRYLSISELGADPGRPANISKLDWSDRIPKLITACQISEDCEALLARQQIELQNRLQERFAALGKLSSQEEERGLTEVAVLAGALDGLGTISRRAGKVTAPYNEAFPQLALRMWRTLGKVALARAIESDMTFMLSLLRSGAAKPFDATQFPHLASNFELLDDDLAGARELNLLLAMSALAEEKMPLAFYALAELARLDAALGRGVQAGQWLDALDKLRAVGASPALASAVGPDCGAGRARAHALMLLAADGGRADEAIKITRGVLADGCGVVGMAQDLGLRLIKRGDWPRAQETVTLLRQQCAQPGKCFETHWLRLEALEAMVRRDPQVLREQATMWLQHFKTAPPAGPFEHQWVWALALTLESIDPPLARALYVALDDAIESVRALTSAKASGLRNLARYDALRRARLKADLVAEGSVDLDKLEALRGQSILRNLQRARWTKDFAGVEDETARSAMEASLASTRQGRSMLPVLSQIERFKFLTEAFAGTLDEVEKSALDQYYATLAARKLQFRDGLTALQTHESNQQIFKYGLREDEAHLSWLNVPGGYLGVLRSGAVHSKNAMAVDQAVMVPEGSGIAETLLIYRDLLQSGAGSTRGARNHDAVVQTPGAGLALRGLPLWHLTTGGVVARVQPPAGASRVRNFAEISAMLHEQLLGPFRASLAGVRRLSISPDAALSLLPFETLVPGGSAVQVGFAISYVQSLKVFYELQERLKDRKMTGTASVLSIADPQFARVPAQGAENGSDVGRASEAERSLAPAWMTSDWPALPGTRKEADAIARLYPGLSRLMGAQASKPALLKLNASGELKTFKTLHFATHGYVDAERSALVLSSTSRTAEAYLFDAELATLSLASDLSVLSACNTGLGPEASGEGVMGLPFALFMAGNLNTLMTLWSVDDEGTAQFIPAYLERVQASGDMVLALRDTKLAFVAGDYGERNRDPRIWAPFVLYGASANGR